MLGGEVTGSLSQAVLSWGLGPTLCRLSAVFTDAQPHSLSSISPSSPVPISYSSMSLLAPEDLRASDVPSRGAYTDG